MPGRRKAFREKQFRKHVKQLRSDPVGARNRPYSRSGCFGWRLLFEAKQEINANAESGRYSAVEALDLFDYIRQLTSLSPTVLRRANCMAVTSRGLLAAADRRLGNYNEAFTQLQIGLAEGVSCGSCRVEILWRQGVFAATVGELEQAETYVLRAISEAHRLGTDHNLDRNGMVAALLGCHVVYYLSERYQDAARVAEEALALTNPETSPDLYKTALHNIAGALTELGSEADLRRADACVREAYSLFDDVARGRNAERATLDLLYGQIQVRHGFEDEGRRLIAKAQADFVGLKMPREAVIATTVLARWHAANGSKWETENSVADLLVSKGGRRSWHAAFTALPREVLRELEKVIRLARRGEFESIIASIVRIREVLKADQMMPCFI